MSELDYLLAITGATLGVTILECGFWLGMAWLILRPKRRPQHDSSLFGGGEE